MLALILLRAVVFSVLDILLPLVRVRGEAILLIYWLGAASFVRAYGTVRTSSV